MPGFSPKELLFLPFLCSVLWKGITRSSLHSGGASSWRGEYLLNIWNSSLRNICPFSPVSLFLQSFIYISLDSGIFYALVVFHYYVIYFVAQIVPAVAIGGTFRLAPVSFDMQPPFLFSSTSLLSGTRRCFKRLIMYIFCPSPRIRHIFKELSAGTLVATGWFCF